jgi:hypothetical protein
MTRKRKQCHVCCFFFFSLPQHYSKSSCDRVAKIPQHYSPNDDDVGGNIPNDLSLCSSIDYDIAGVAEGGKSSSAELEEELNLYEMFIANCNPTLPAVPSPPTISPLAHSNLSPRTVFELPVVSHSSSSFTMQQEVAYPVGLKSGEALVVPPSFQKGQYCFTNNDHSIMRMDIFLQ